MTIGLAVPDGIDIVSAFNTADIRSWMGPVDGGWSIVVEGVPVVTIVSEDGPFQLDPDPGVAAPNWVATTAPGVEIYRGHDTDELIAAVRAAWAAEPPVYSPTTPTFRLVAFRAPATAALCPCGAPTEVWYRPVGDDDVEPQTQCHNRTCHHIY